MGRFKDMRDRMMSNGHLFNDPINEGTELLKEGLIKSYPTELLAKALDDKFDIELTLVSIPSEGDVGMVNFIPKKDYSGGEFLEFERTLNAYGYINGLKVGSYEKGVEYAVEPKFPQEANGYIRNYGDKIFHVSPSKYREKIAKRGLIPRDSLSKFHFKGRVYLFSSTLPKLHDNPDLIRELIQKEVVGMLMTDPSKNEIEWDVYEIDGSGLKFHHDQFVINQVFFSFFTLENIPPRSVRRVGTLIIEQTL